jgi:Tol biopolymer transport system component
MSTPKPAVLNFLGTLLMLLLVSESAAAQLERISVASDGSQADNGSYQAVVSDDGSVIAYRSNATNLVASDTNNWPDIFLSDLNAGTTERISLTTAGEQSVSYSKAPSISSDGQRIVFEGRPVSGITTVNVFDRATDTLLDPLPDTSSFGATTPGQARNDPSISGDGRFFVFQSDSPMTNAFPTSIRPITNDSDTLPDVYVYDLDTSPTPPLEHVSRITDTTSLSAQLQADNRNPFMSETGRYVVFESFSDQLMDDGNNQGDILRKDRETGVLQLVSATQAGTSGNAASLEPAVSDDGNVVAFRSDASDLVAGDTNDRLDIFVRDISAGTTVRVSVASDGSEANQNSLEPDLSGDGRFVVFRSTATNLVPGDTNQRPDVFVHDRDSGATARVGQPAGGESNGSSANPSISGDGHWIVFESDATNLVDGDTNGARDIFRAPNPFLSPSLMTTEGL